jgi:hypothetical protein
MSNLSSIFIVISSLLALVSPLIYVHAILRGEVKPHRTTRLVLLFITSLTTAALFAQHDRVAIWLAGVSTFQSIVVFSLSLKYGMGGWGKTDLLCLGIALLGILLWQTTDNPILALYAAITADLIGMTPTLIKTFYFPKTEIMAFYLLDAIAAFFSLLAIQTWSLSGFSYPLYLMIVNLSMVGLIFLPKQKKLAT